MEKIYGFSEQLKLPDTFGQHLEEFYRNGYTIIENVISPDELRVLRHDLTEIYKLQEANFGAENLHQIGEKNLARALLAYSDTYCRLALRSDMLAYVQKILGDYFVLHLQNGIINMPGEEHHQSAWHRDLPYQNWVCSEPLACNVYYCLDKFDKDTGGTFILPFSHQHTEIPSAAYIEKNAVQVDCSPGSVLLFNSMILHRAGYNQSDTIRRGINHLYTKPILRQQIDFPRLLRGKYSEDPISNRIFGYDAQTMESVEAFRERRFQKINKQ